jgi:HEAT repeat protein
MLVLTGEQSWAEAVASVLASDAFWGVRIDAAMALADFAPTPELIEILDEATRDPHELVQYHAANTLRRYRRRGGAGAG